MEAFNALNYKVVGTGDNLVLERTDEAGRSTSARPASAEEMEMYKRVVALSATVQILTREIQATDTRLRAALVHAPELAEVPMKERPDKLAALVADVQKAMSEGQP